LSQKKRLRKR